MNKSEALHFIGDFLENFKSADFEGQEGYLVKMNESLREYPEFSAYVETEFVHILKNDYCPDLVKEYYDLWETLQEHTNNRDVFDVTADVTKFPLSFTLFAQDNIVKKYPELLENVVESRITYLNKNKENLNWETNLQIVSAIAKIKDDEKCAKLLNRLFSIPLRDATLTESFVRKLPTVFKSHTELGDDILKIINKNDWCEQYMETMAEFAVIDEVKTEEVLSCMHARVQRKPRDSSLLNKYYKAMESIIEELPKFRSLAETFAKEALTYAENDSVSRRSAAKLLNDQQSLGSRAQIGKRTDPAEKNPYDYKYIDSVKDDEICFLTIGGDMALKDEAANGYAKRAFEFLKDLRMEKEVSVYGVAYDFGDLFDEKKALGRQMSDYGHVKYNAEYFSQISEETKNPQFIRKLFETFILPRISQNNGKNRRETNDAASRMAKFKIWAHCFGAYVTLKLEELSLQKMEQLGYKEDERLFIQKQMQVLAISPHCPLGVSKSNLLAIVSAQDNNVTHGNFFEQQIRKMVGKGKIIPLSYFPEKQGRFILVNRMFGDDNKKYNGSDEDEHNFCSLRPVAATSKAGILAIKLARNFLQNGFERAKDSKTDIISDMEWLTKSKSEEKAFAKMQANGKELMQAITENVLKEHHKHGSKTSG